MVTVVFTFIAVGLIMTGIDAALSAVLAVYPILSLAAAIAVIRIVWRA